jgi:hypothetical protein
MAAARACHRRHCARRAAQSLPPGFLVGFAGIGGVTRGGPDAGTRETAPLAVVVTAAVPWPAMAAAVCAAFAFGTSGALQHHVARRTDRGGRFGVVRSLARERVWLASLPVNGAGVVLQVVALSHAPVALVQPALVLDLLFAVLGASVLRPDRVVVGGALLCAGGQAVFLLLAAPAPGTTVPRPGEALLLDGGVVAIVGGCVVAARRGRGTRRALSLAAGDRPPRWR